MKQRLIDGDKLLYRAYEIYEDDDLTMYDLIAETESGKFDTTSDQGEATRLREALNCILNGSWSRTYDLNGLEVWTTNRINPFKIANEALSSHTEDTGIQDTILL